MAANQNLSVDEILAACRAADGEGGQAAAPEAAAESSPPAESAAAEESAAEESAAEESAPSAGTAKPAGEMSVAEMLAAARAEKSGAAPAKPAASPAPAAAAGSSAKKSGEMSVAEMLAAARSEKSMPAGTEKAAAKKPAVKAKPAAAAGKGSPKKEPAAKPAGPKDTASILAAARGAKPGPITKAEAAAKQTAEAPRGKPKLEVPPMPEKPAYARPRPAVAASSQGEDRRGFLATVAAAFVGSSLAVGFSSLAVTNLLWGLGLARFMFPNILTEPPTQFKVGFPDELAPGQVETKYKAQFGVWVVRSEYDGAPQIFALQSVCTHLGCTPNWLEGEQKFKCPCHGSGFYKDGINFEGPAPRPLERFAIRLADDGQLEVDKSRKFKEEVGQWRDSASFVPV